MAVKHGLGKGLDALLALDEEPKQETGSAKSLSGEGGEVRVPIEKIQANPGQPRKVFDEEALQELAASIREHGIIQPLIVEQTSEGNYLLVAGERRLRAARLVGLRDVPVIIRNYSDERRLEVALVENVQRSDLNPIEEALAYKKLMEITGLSQDEVASRVGKNRSTVANALRLLKLPEDMQQALATGVLTSGHGRAILSVINPADQRVLYEKIVEKDLSVREAERLAQELNRGSRASETKGSSGAKGEKQEGQSRDPELAAIEQRCIEALGTKVVIQGDLKRGTVKIEYYSMEDLERLLYIFTQERR